MEMKSFARQSLKDGHPVRRIDLAKAIGRDKGPHKVSLQRISDYRTELRLSHKRPVAKPKKQIIPAKEQIAYEFLVKWQKVPKCDLHWFDEKPMYANTVPRGTYAEVGVDAQVQKTKSAETHYSQLTLCNTVYGFLVLDVIKHDKNKGTSRDAFIKQCKEVILPILKEAYECRRNKVQYLFLNKASIHLDNGWDEVSLCFKPYAEVHHLPSAAHELLSPLDFSLFRQQQHYYSFLLNSTEKEVREAIEASERAVSVDNVIAAVRTIGYGQVRQAFK